MQVNDPTAEWQLKLAALMKTCALGQGKLQALPGSAHRSQALPDLITKPKVKFKTTQ